MNINEEQSESNSQYKDIMKELVDMKNNPDEQLKQQHKAYMTALQETINSRTNEYKNRNDRLNKVIDRIDNTFSNNAFERIIELMTDQTKPLINANDVEIVSLMRSVEELKYKVEWMQNVNEDLMNKIDELSTNQEEPEEAIELVKKVIEKIKEIINSNSNDLVRMEQYQADITKTPEE